METLVIVPARRGAQGPEMETRHMEAPHILGPELALPVFSSPEKLVRLFGARQPWICVPLRLAREAAAAAGLAQVAIDPEGLNR